MKKVIECEVCRKRLVDGEWISNYVIDEKTEFLSSQNCPTCHQKFLDEQTKKDFVKICSICKKYYDEKDGWKHDEQYVSRVESYETDDPYVEASHTYCPECHKEEMKKIIGE